MTTLENGSFSPTDQWSLNESIAFAIVPDEVRYPDRIVGIALLLK